MPGSGACARPTAADRFLAPSLAQHFRDQASRDEYGITGLCQTCQDITFKPTADEIAGMAADPDYERCDVCGEWRFLEAADVGVGVIRGHDCCAGIRFRGRTPPAPVLPHGRVRILRGSRARVRDVEEVNS